MIYNNILLIIVIITILLVLLSFYPLIYLKYHRDLYDNVNMLNTMCYDNSISMEDNVNIPIKKTFIWNICKVLFYFDRLKNNFNKVDTLPNDDFKLIDRYKSPNTIMFIYDFYLYCGLPLFIFIFFGFTIRLYYVYCNQNIDNIFITLYFFIYFIFIIVFLSLILKKITEIYCDCNVYSYIMLIKELEIIVNENYPENKGLIDILKKTSNSDIKNIEDIFINENVIDDLIDYKNNNNNNNIKNTQNFIFTLQNLDKMKTYIDIESTLKICSKIDKTTILMNVYILLLFPLLYILSSILKELYIYLIFIIIIILLVIITIYNLSNIFQ
jgi:hypothetical protein